MRRHRCRTHTVLSLTDEDESGGLLRYDWNVTRACTSIYEQRLIK
jgi:hypothetical protein